MLRMLKERFRPVLKSSSLGILCLLVAVPGCWDDGPKIVPVSGKVLRDGKALTNVAVTFLPVGSGLSATGSADSSGTIKMLTNGRSGAIQDWNYGTAPRHDAGIACVRLSSSNEFRREIRFAGIKRT